jgi:hypothetical protein
MRITRLFALLLVVALAAAQPDLAIYDIDVAASLSLEKLLVVDPCLRDHACITSDAENPLVLRFDTTVHNIAAPAAARANDAAMGEPNHAAMHNVTLPDGNGTAQAEPMWEWHECHDHWHFRMFASYKLFFADGYERGSPNNTVAAEGSKVSFCLSDVGCTRDGVKSHYTCEQQGISPGCYDRYSGRVDCQWIDVTDVDRTPGLRYILLIVVDPYDVIHEVSAAGAGVDPSANNVAEVLVDFGAVPSHDAQRKDLITGAFVVAPLITLLFYLKDQRTGGGGGGGGDGGTDATPGAAQRPRNDEAEKSADSHDSDSVRLLKMYAAGEEEW